MFASLGEGKTLKMKLQNQRLGVALLSAAICTVPMTASAQTPASPKPKISVPPKKLHDAKTKQDTMIKRSQRHPEATSGNSASGENPSSPNPNPTPSPH